MMSFITYWFRCSRAIIFKRCCLLTIFANPLSEPRIFAPPLAARDLTDFTEGFLSDGQNRFRGIRQIRDVRGSDYKRAEEIEYTAFTINLLPRFQIHPSPFTLHPSPFTLRPSNRNHFPKNPVIFMTALLKWTLSRSKVLRDVAYGCRLKYFSMRKVRTT